MHTSSHAALGSRRLLFLAVVLFSACSTDADLENTSPAAMQRYTLQHGGLEREYFVFRPSSYSTEAPSPVAFFLHGYGGTATGTEAEVTQGLNRYAEKFGYVMVYPQGTWFMAGDATRWEVRRGITYRMASMLGPAVQSVHRTQSLFRARRSVEPAVSAGGHPVMTISGF